MRLQPNRVMIELEGPYFGGEYVADLHAVSSLLTDYSHRQLVRYVMDCWPELTGTVESRKWLRRQPSFVLAIMLRQL